MNSPSASEVKAHVWERVAKEHPEFTPAMDIMDNYHVVGEIVLGGSIPWGVVNTLFKPSPGALVMDVGANVGVYTAFCAANGAHVSAYEPFPAAFSKLCEMLYNAGLVDNVSVYQKAIWTLDGDVAFSGHHTFMENTEWYNGSIPGGLLNPKEFLGKRLVPTVSFEKAIGNVDWDFVKMDIEGAEFDILIATPEEALRRIKFLFVELHPWVSDAVYRFCIKRLESIFYLKGHFSDQLQRYEAIYLAPR